MLKKILPLVGCLAPLGAGAVTVLPSNPVNWTPGVGAVIGSLDGAITGVSTGAVDANVAMTAAGLNVSGGDTSTGLNIAGDLYIGAVPNALGSMYTTDDVASFAIQSDGGVTVAGNTLVATGKSLTISNARRDVAVVLGQLTANGAFYASDVNNFKVNSAVVSDTDLDIDAGSVDIDGGVDINNGNARIVSGTTLDVGNLVNSGNGTVALTAKTITANDGVGGGTIQNLAGVMNINVGSGGYLETYGNLENSGPADDSVDGAKMTVTGGSVIVAGTMKNDSNRGGMYFVNVRDVSVTGGTGGVTPSLVNKGDFFIDATGDVGFDAGVDLTSMGDNNQFIINANSISLGNSNLLVSKGTIGLTAKNGDIRFKNLVNGIDSAATAVTTLAAKNVVAGTVTNRGELNINSLGDATSGVSIKNGLNVLSGAVNILMNGAVEIGAASPDAWGVSNAADTEINGASVEIAGVVNTGAIRITSLNDTGVINITGDVTNDVTTHIAQTADDMFINARTIDIAGTLNNQNGVTTVVGATGASDNALRVGAINVDGGVLNLNALNGGISVSDFAPSVALGNRPLGTIDVGPGGAMNIGNATYNVTAQNGIDIAGNVTLGGAMATSGGNVNINPSTASAVTMAATNGNIHVGGNVSATNTDGVARELAFVADEINIDGGVTATGAGNKLVFGQDGADQDLTVLGDVAVNGGASVEVFDANDVSVGALDATGGNVIMHGTGLSATNGAIQADDILIGDAGTRGFVVRGDEFALVTESDGAAISVGGVTLDASESLRVESAGDATFGGAIENKGTLTASAKNGTITFAQDITNDGNIFVGDALNTGAQNISGADLYNGPIASNVNFNVANKLEMGDITNYGSLTMIANTMNLGALDLYSQTTITSTGNDASVTAASLVASRGQTNINTPKLTVANQIRTSGDMTQGDEGMLNLNGKLMAVNAGSISVGRNYIASSGDVAFDVANAVSITGDVTVAKNASTAFNAGDIISANDVIVNGGNLELAADKGIKLNVLANNGGVVTLDSGDGVAAISEYTTNTGATYLRGAGLDALGAVKVPGSIYHNTGATAGVGDIAVDAKKYTIDTSNIVAKNIYQDSGEMIINTSDVDITGDVRATNLRFAAAPMQNWMNVDVAGDVSGGVKFVGLEKMTIGGDYTFNDASQINAAILPYAAGGVMDSTDVNYWSTVSLNDDNTLGRITNATDGGAMISVGGAFISELNNLGTAPNGTKLSDAQVGIVLRDVVDQGTAIWLLHADGGLADDAFAKMRDVNVSFCNADGSICYNYMDSLNANNGTDEQLPVYLSQRDSDGDGNADSLYVVFDPRFGGPVEVFKIQPIVARTDDYTTGEYVSAGALDDLVIGQLHDKLFLNGAPIETIPLAFAGTNMQEMANELYDRMEYYVLERDGDALARFSRLFQPREIEQIAGSVVLNEHTNFRSFEDRMFDEFIWNRNRNLRKAWADVEFGMFVQDVTDNKRVDGNRFNVSGGFDWQESETLIVGLTGRLSHMSGDNSDSMNLGYRVDMPYVAGNVDMTVSDTNLGLGAYLMKILGDKTRLYGNGFLDIHFLDVDRTQNYVGRIDGDGTAVSLTSEWGLMHDWLNQYVVGNAYARIGYNFGFDVTEQVAGDDYMELESDGYFILTPGYSLTAQKRIYPSSWFQIRPYATIGVEYDVLGAPDHVKYKFAPAATFTEYDINIDPLWANIGGGFEFLSATGIQVGLDYRYQYNNDIQLHNVKVSGSYRF